MGILDDAIREHLELKRQHGAESDDLERLENEAFGAPARPGDPEFGEPDTGASQEAAPTEAEFPSGSEEGGNTDDWLAAEEETTVSPQAPATASPAVQARSEHAHLDDTASHPAPPVAEPQPPVEPAPAETTPDDDPPPLAAEPLPPEAEAEAPAAELQADGPPEAAPEPPEAPERAIFDAEEFDLDLDLELDEEDDGTVGPQAADAEGSGGAPATEPLPPETAAGPQPAPFVEDDTDNPPLPIEPPVREAAPEGEDGEEKAEDLLEETPDFLQDAPEGEDLWFEQGPPKDFDFDDD